MDIEIVFIATIQLSNLYSHEIRTDNRFDRRFTIFKQPLLGKRSPIDSCLLRLCVGHCLIYETSQTELRNYQQPAEPKKPIWQHSL